MCFLKHSIIWVFQHVLAWNIPKQLLGQFLWLLWSPAKRWVLLFRDNCRKEVGTLGNYVKYEPGTNLNSWKFGQVSKSVFGENVRCSINGFVWYQWWKKFRNQALSPGLSGYCNVSNGVYWSGSTFLLSIQCSVTNGSHGATNHLFICATLA